ncbi:MAG: hybrid sensor histidine kinase/response regulator [Sphingobacteriales bacterium]|nr:MAG: hybrid sensor histidine kinase/response regulator [Sphingobacteriales bacterium]
MHDTIKVLLIDDDEEDYLITRDIFSEFPAKKYSLQWVSSYAQGKEQISKQAHDVYLVDYRLGAESGLELIEKAVQNGITAPLILLTGQGDIEIDEKAMRIGAADYLVKGKFNPHQLERSIRYAIKDAQNIAEIKNLNAELENRVEERTRELAEAIQELAQSKSELLKALEKEKELNEMKSRFVTMASHEFRTPLSTILSSASLIDRYKTEEDDSKRQKHITRIKGSVQNLIEILDSFLSLSKLEEGKVPYAPAEFDLKDFSEKLLEEVSSITKEGQKLIYEHQGNEKAIFEDRQIMHTILINLVSNSIKYSPEGKNIYLRTYIDGEKNAFEVQDEGIGIPLTEQKHLFERFFRAKNAINIQGTGLGLNIVKRYVDMLGGNISFTSNINSGTTFTISLPKHSD